MTENYVEVYTSKLPVRLRIWAAWNRVKEFAGLAWRNRKLNPIVWVTNVRAIRAAKHAYIRDLERAALCGPDYDR